MRMRRVLVAVSCATVMVAGACSAGPSAKPPVVLAPTTTVDIGPHACTYVTPAEAKAALTENPRQSASSTANDVTSCAYRTGDADTDLIVRAGGGGADAFDRELDLAEADLDGRRAAVPGVAGGYLISGSQLGAPLVLVGAVRGRHWFTAALRIDGVGRATLEQRMGVILETAAGRLGA